MHLPPVSPAIATRLQAYVLGEGAAAWRADVEAHLAACETCRTEVARLAGLLLALGRSSAHLRLEERATLALLRARLGG